MTKGLDLGNPGNVYELRKFERADRMVVNQAAWRLMLDSAGALPARMLREV